MAEVVKAPGNVVYDGRHTVFLAGSIEMGKADNWQVRFADEFKDEDAILINPRRDFWDSSWTLRSYNENFKQQVDWELDNLERCHVIAMYFDPKTTSPISLLELGMFSQTGRMVVCCPDGFYRKGNVEIVCDRDNVVLTEKWSDFIVAVKQKLYEWNGIGKRIIIDNKPKIDPAQPIEEREHEPIEMPGDD